MGQYEQPDGCRRVQSGADKSRVLDDLLLSKAIDSQTKGLTAYIGDSASDISPLLAADVGIIVGQNKLLRQVCTAAGITIKPLAAGELRRPFPRSCNLCMGLHGSAWVQNDCPHWQSLKICPPSFCFVKSLDW